jgi:type VI secretion system protein ImpL
MRQEAATLPPAVGSVAGQIAQGVEALAKAGAGNELARQYGEVQRECSAAFRGRYPFDSASVDDVPIDDFGRILGYNGVFENFFKTHLEPYVDTTRSTWAWRPDPPSGVSTAMLRQLEAAQRIRETFFRPGAQRPELQFSVTPLTLDASATRFLLEIDGQPIEYRHGPEQPRSATWPGPKPGEAAVTFEESSSRRANQVAKGAWAWFRLLDEGGSLQRETDARHVVTFQKGGHQARVRIEARSIRNPFATRDVQQFRCGDS